MKITVRQMTNRVWNLSTNVSDKPEEQLFVQYKFFEWLFHKMTEGKKGAFSKLVDSDWNETMVEDMTDEDIISKLKSFL